MSATRESLISEGRLVGQLMHKHRGRSKGATVRQLAEALTGQASNPAVERHIRHLVVDMRKKGIPICACPSQGYYMAATDEELEDTLRNLHDRAMTSLQQLAALKKMALPELMGQMGLDTRKGDCSNA